MWNESRTTFLYFTPLHWSKTTLADLPEKLTFHMSVFPPDGHLKLGQVCIFSQPQWPNLWVGIKIRVYQVCCSDRVGGQTWWLLTIVDSVRHLHNVHWGENQYRSIFPSYKLASHSWEDHSGIFCVLEHLCAAIDRGLLFQQMHILPNLSLPRGLI